MVVRDISPLICPFAQVLRIYGAVNLQCLIEIVNEGWDNSIPLTKPHLQPDYAVGFKRTAFTKNQLKKIQPFINNLSKISFFMGTYYVHTSRFSRAMLSAVPRPLISPADRILTAWPWR
jgi:hypothetical protein